MVPSFRVTIYFLRFELQVFITIDTIRILYLGRREGYNDQKVNPWELHLVHTPSNSLLQIQYTDSTLL